MPHPLFISLFMLAFLAGVMAAAWAVQRAMRNAGWVDVFWTFGTGAAGALAALSAGLSERSTLAAALVLIWALRLGLYILLRTRGIPHEDARYARFRAEWGTAFEPRMFGLLMVQALAAWPLAIAVALAAWCPAPLGGVSLLAGVLIAVIAVAGEALADRQMHQFRHNPANKGKVCDIGLWGWSRHPNYFFEWLYWLAYPVLALGGFWPWGWLAFIAPVLMFLLLTKISGVPMLEREMLASRGEKYRAYQQRVPAFFPRPPRSHSPFSPYPGV
jgi:steroid 5-alpha reductase family enzyme